MMSREEFLRQVDRIINNARGMIDEKDPGDIWTRDVEALEEMKDILHDYDRQAAQLQAMIRKYEQAERPIRKGAELYLCPLCNHRVNPRHSHCHWCGKKIGRWGANAAAENK